MNKVIALLVVMVLVLGGIAWYQHKALEVHAMVIGSMSEYIGKLQEQKKLPTWEELNK